MSTQMANAYLICTISLILSLILCCDCNEELCTKSGNEVFYRPVLKDIVVGGLGEFDETLTVNVRKERFTTGIKVEVSYVGAKYLEKEDLFVLTEDGGLELNFEIPTNPPTFVNDGKILSSRSSVLLNGLILGLASPGHTTNSNLCFAFGYASVLKLVNGQDTEELCMHSAALTVVYSDLEYCEHRILYDENNFLKRIELENECTSTSVPSKAPVTLKPTSAPVTLNPTPAPVRIIEPTESPTSMTPTYSPTSYKPSKSPTIAPTPYIATPTRSPATEFSEIVQTFERNVTSDIWTQLGPFRTETVFVVNMTGVNGDADLYVQEGKVPTKSTYQCRPYKVGNTEDCEVKGAGNYYVGVIGYSTNADGITLKVRTWVVVES